MSNIVHITATVGPMKGKAFAFEEHDTFLFGRLEARHCRLPDVFTRLPSMKITEVHQLIPANWDESNKYH